MRRFAAGATIGNLRPRRFRVVTELRSPQMSMVRIGRVALGRVPRIVVAVGGDSPRVAEAVQAGADLLELRVDWLARPSAEALRRALRALKRHGVPLIGTIRSRSEGGRATLTNTQRSALYAALLPWVDAIDVDAGAGGIEPVIAAARRQGKPVIFSHHDLRRTPAQPQLERFVKQARRRGADLVKIAALARSFDDVARLLVFTHRHRTHHLVTVAMGRLGSISRVLFPLAGSLLTYTSVVPRDGQVPLPRLVDDLRFYGRACFLE